jgi:hypothetical protein
MQYESRTLRSNRYNTTFRRQIILSDCGAYSVDHNFHSSEAPDVEEFVCCDIICEATELTNSREPAMNGAGTMSALGNCFKMMIGASPGNGRVFTMHCCGMRPHTEFGKS